MKKPDWPQCVTRIQFFLQFFEMTLNIWRYFLLTADIWIDELNNQNKTETMKYSIIFTMRSKIYFVIKINKPLYFDIYLWYKNGKFCDKVNLHTKFSARHFTKKMYLEKYVWKVARHIFLTETLSQTLL